MHRIIDREVFKGNIHADKWDVTLHDLGNGHREVSICQSVSWEHEATMSDEAYAMYLDAKAAYETPEVLEEKRLAHRERAARRAKTKVRRICKVMGVDALLTLTFRENVTDFDRARAYLKEFIRRMRRLVPGFQYVAAAERQARGAWHWHLAIHALPKDLPASNGVKVKSYSVVLAVWRRVTGEAGGAVNQSLRKRHSRKTSSKVASYISKYVLKAFVDGDDHTNRYSSSSVDLPPSVRRRFVAASLADLIQEVYRDFVGSGVLTSPWLSSWGDRFFLTIEPAPPYAFFAPPPWVQ